MRVKANRIQNWPIVRRSWPSRQSQLIGPAVSSSPRAEAAWPDRPTTTPAPRWSIQGIAGASWTNRAGAHEHERAAACRNEALASVCASGSSAPAAMARPRRAMRSASSDATTPAAAAGILSAAQQPYPDSLGRSGWKGIDWARRAAAGRHPPTDVHRPAGSLRVSIRSASTRSAILHAQPDPPAPPPDGSSRCCAPMNAGERQLKPGHADAPPSRA